MSETTDWGRLRVGCVLSGALVLAAYEGGSPVPELPSEVALAPEAVSAIPTPDVVARVVDLQPTRDGRTWVLNSVAPFFVVLDADGQVEREFGQRGGGPAEFGAPWALVEGLAPSDVWAFDARRNALILVSEIERRELGLSVDSVPPSSLISFKGAGINQAPLWLERIDDGFLLARSEGPLRETALQTWNADIWILSDAASEAALARYAPVSELVGDPATKYGAASTMLPYPVWSVCQDGTVGLYEPVTNTLRHVTRDGEELSTFALPVERRVEITADRLFDMFFRQLKENITSGQLPDEAEARRLTQEQNEELVSTSAGVFSEYTDMHCTSNDTFWLRPFDVDAVRLGQGSEWLRVRPDGSQTQIGLPSGFRTHRIEGGRIWGTIQDAMGVESIAWIGTPSIP